MRRLLREWDVFLAIMALGVLTGLIVFMVTDRSPETCHSVLAPHSRYLTWVCSHP